MSLKPKKKIGVLPQIAGEINPRKGYGFISDVDLRDMVARDCREINQAAKAGAAKSVILLCGSLIDTLLYDLLKNNEANAKKEAGKLAGQSSESRKSAHHKY